MQVHLEMVKIDPMYLYLSWVLDCGLSFSFPFIEFPNFLSLKVGNPWNQL